VVGASESAHNQDPMQTIAEALSCKRQRHNFLAPASRRRGRRRPHLSIAIHGAPVLAVVGLWGASDGSDRHRAESTGRLSLSIVEATVP
jgi:hypothetical protein